MVLEYVGGKFILIEKNNIEILQSVQVREWYAFFSQTGNELAKVIQMTGKEPTKIITNRTMEEVKATVNPWLYENYKHIITYVPNRPTVHDYIDAIGYRTEDKLLTMHGWLRILPDTICHRYTAFNGHPGLITKYPELRGKDPQIKAYMGNYVTGGCVIHEITPELDEGPICLSKEVLLDDLSLDETFLKLYDTSLQLWLEFFKEIKWLEE
jgi:folate-dependent phosphoribosylglycinamide formyltransferase PurN